MITDLTIAALPLNPIVGDLAGNAARLAAAVRGVRADLVLTPELSLCGYPADDLVLKPAFVQACRDEIERLADDLRHGPAVLVGLPWQADGVTYNAAALLADGVVAAVRFKHHLPNHGVFDEQRVFVAGPLPAPIDYNGHRLGVMICEDMWSANVAAHLAAQGATGLLVLNASPYRRGIAALRRDMARARTREVGLGLMYVNQLGGQDDLVFDGDAFVMTADGTLCAEAAPWRGAALLSHDRAAPVPRDGWGDIHAAITLALRDYVDKCGFPGVVLGLSGGIDSALTLSLAVDALGAARVRTVMMPSLYTSPDSIADAAAQAAALGVAHAVMPIAPIIQSLTEQLHPVIGAPEGLTAENLQSRARGVLLMAVSNATGAMVLTTGNKSELAVGYATLYGDMCGGYNPLKDLYKTDVYGLAHWCNARQPVIPARVLTRPPSAELRPDQTDQDSLPPYDVLDAILRALVDDDRAAADVVAMGHDAATVRRIEQLVVLAEYKRYQAPPGVKLGPRAFGRDRRYPLVNHFRTHKDPS